MYLSPDSLHPIPMNYIVYLVLKYWSLRLTIYWLIVKHYLPFHSCHSSCTTPSTIIMGSFRFLQVWERDCSLCGHTKKKSRALRFAWYMSAVYSILYYLWHKLTCYTFSAISAPTPQCEAHLTAICFQTFLISTFCTKLCVSGILESWNPDSKK